MATQKKTTKLIAGFPGVGKSVLYHMYGKGFRDSDSSKYSWTSNGRRNPNFPANYVKHILSRIGKDEVVMVSTHETVRDALIAEGVYLTIVYPARELKDEYLERYKQRNNTPQFIEFMDKNWDKFLDEIEALEGVNKVELKSNQFLADVFEEVPNIVPGEE